MNKRVCVIGLGHVGLPLATKIASLNHTVLGIDSDSNVISHLRNGISPFFENGLLDLLTSPVVKANLRLTESWADVTENDVIIVTVGTPITSRGEPNLTYLDDCTNSLGKVLSIW